MTKENQYSQFKSMVSDKLEIIKEQNFSNDDFDVDIFGCIVELTTMIFTTIRLTEITEQQIENFIKHEINMSLDELSELENSFY
ncbi:MULTISPECIES: hypothetical protein [Staphylococcus]|uniref:Uncharacterized protein n=2 Tax=Staphylococcus TaxID=1279 RepID=A0A0M2P1T0_STACC|nr:hypothetical protein [Staphylococcus cohnii]KKI64769.1 hypothetical protein UF66_2290 [Staphylococcus cohnii subsp. cohnii]PTI73456.1 hypothetical protein BU064_13700 [Staphylococcus succinus]